MRTVILVISVCAAVFFAAAFAATFFAKDYVRGQAEEFVIVKTRQFAEPAVGIAEQAVQAPAIKLVLDDAAIETTRNELAEYRSDPNAYIARLVAGERLPAPAGRNAGLRERVQQWKLEIREHFDKTMDRLIFDLRIFFGSNLAAALIATWFARKAKDGKSAWLLTATCLLLASMAFCSYRYVDNLTYFRIIFNSYLGWWYPALLAVTFLGLYLEYGREKPEPANTPPSSSSATDQSTPIRSPG